MRAHARTHATPLQARAAAASCDYPAFFRAYATAPALGRALLDVMVPKLRWGAINVLVRGRGARWPVMGVGLPGVAILRAGGSQRGGGSKGLLPGMRQATYVGLDRVDVQSCKRLTPLWAQRCVVHPRAVADAAAPPPPRPLLPRPQVKAYKTPLPLSFVAGLMGFAPPPPAAAPAASGTSTAAEAARAAAPAASPPALEPLPGCRHTVCEGKAAPAPTVAEGVAACSQWLEAHGAVVEVTGGWCGWVWALGANWLGVLRRNCGSAAWQQPCLAVHSSCLATPQEAHPRVPPAPLLDRGRRAAAGCEGQCEQALHP